MNNKSIIIKGEAPETDSEDETITPTFTPVKLAQSIQGALIKGEDSESEEDNGSVSSAASALSPLNDALKEESNRSRLDPDNCNSLLHQKLCECNTMLKSNLEEFCSNTINQACRSLGMIDQQLLRSQLTVQSTVTALRSLSINSESLKNKIRSILSSKFISNININSLDV